MPPIVKPPRLSNPGDGTLADRPVDLGEEPVPVPHTDLDQAAASGPAYRSRTGTSPGAGMNGAPARRPRRKL